MDQTTREQIRDHYSKDGAEYDQVRIETPHGLLLSKHDMGIFRRMFPAEPGQINVLEVGAGTGRFTMIALERGITLQATDINQAMLTELEKKVEAAGATDRCRIQVDDIFNLSMEDATFDYVFSLHVIPRFLTLEDQHAAIVEVGRVIKPGGQFLFNYRNSRSFYNLFYRGHAASPSQIEKALEEAGMRVVEKRGKWFLNRSLLNKLPLPVGRFIALVDRVLERVLPNLAWDVFLIARKES